MFSIISLKFQENWRKNIDLTDKQTSCNNSFLFYYFINEALLVLSYVLISHLIKSFSSILLQLYYQIFRISDMVLLSHIAAISPIRGILYIATYMGGWVHLSDCLPPLISCPMAQTNQTWQTGLLGWEKSNQCDQILIRILCMSQGH